MIYLDITLFLSTIKQSDMLVAQIEQEIIDDLAQSYSEIAVEHRLVDSLCKMNQITGRKLILIIDEWDVLIRDEAANKKVQENFEIEIVPLPYN